MHVALFDFDGTLTSRDSLLPFLKMTRGSLCFGLAMLKVFPVLVGYALKLVQNNVAKELLLINTIGGMSSVVLNTFGEEFAQHIIPAMLRKDMQERLIEHQMKGHCCILVSASLDVYLVPWAKLVGFDYCISTSLEVSAEGVVTGRLNGGNCYGDEKVRRIEQLFSKIGLPSRVYAYGDSDGDVPMIEMADEGYWVRNGIQQFSKN